MKKYFVISFLFIFAFFISVSNTFSQSNDKIKGAITDIPNEMQAGQTASITVTVTNKSKDMSWSSDQLKLEVTGPFQVTNPSVSERAVTLEPGQSADLTLILIAPADVGKQKLTLVIYNNEIKLARKTKNIKIITADETSKPKEEKGEELNKDEGKDKGKDVNKDNKEDKGKDKEKDNGKDKEKDNGKDKNKDK